jgi:hypothetical protein
LRNPTAGKVVCWALAKSGHTAAANRGIRLGNSLEPGGNVWSLADDVTLLRVSRSDYFVDDHDARGNADPRLQRRGRFQRFYRGHQFKRRSNRALRIILVCFRISKMNQGGVAGGAGDEPIVTTSRFNNAAVITLNNLSQIFRVHSCGCAAEQELT